MHKGSCAKLFDVRLNAIHTFGLHIRQILFAFNINILSSNYGILRFRYLVDLTHLKKDHTNALVCRQWLLEIKNMCCDFIQIYTDGSWDGNAVASVTVRLSETIFKRLHLAFICTAKAQMIVEIPNKTQHLHASTCIIFRVWVWVWVWVWVCCCFLDLFIVAIMSSQDGYQLETVDLWQLYKVDFLVYQAACTLNSLLTQSHYRDTKPTSPCPIL